MPSLEWLLLIAGALLLISTLAGKVSGLLGVPSLVIFLAIGMLAGSDGLGGIYFDNAAVAQAIGVTALAFILFSGGLDTPWSRVRPVAGPALLLSTLGVVLTALAVGLFAAWVLDLPLEVGLLLGAVVSSTDAAAVFSILGSRSIRLREPLEPLLELESGSNDPMAVILTVGLISVITAQADSILALAGTIVVQLVVGALAGVAIGRLGVLLINSLRLQQEGLYTVVSVALVALAYGGTTLVGGSGILAVYLAGIVMGNREFIHKASLVRFHDGLAWLMQIAMFLTLGLLVFPSQLVAVAGVSLAIAAFLILVARPVAVFISLSLTKWARREKVLISWVGLRGAAPIILATFPLLAGLPEAQSIFNVVFFVVLTSVLIQGTTIPLVARWLKLNAPSPVPQPALREHAGEHLVEIEIKEGSPAAGKRIIDLRLPEQVLIVLIARDGAHIVPRGSTELLSGDSVLVAANEKQTLELVRRLLSLPIL
jgi:cell volume regulation protein A